MGMNEELSRLGEPPTTPEELAEAARLSAYLERGEAATPPADAPIDPAILQAVDWMNDHVVSAVVRADADELEELGSAFPGFELQYKLGRGGMGVVFLARDLALDRLVALKVVVPEGADNPRFVERFRHEARMMARLSHPRIPRVQAFGKAGDVFYLVMDYVAGGSLRERLKNETKLPPQEALQVAVAVCDALAHAHGEGVIHRDISPENILFAPSNHVMVIDLGLAKLRDTRGPTRTGYGMGKEGYMAPEQAEDAAHVDHRADIYAVGVVLHEMLTGKRPTGDINILTQTEDVSEETRELLRVAMEVVQKALKRSPEERFQSAAHMKATLEQALTPPLRLRRRWPWWLVTAVVGLALLIPAVILGWWSISGSSRKSGVLRWGGDANGGAPFVWGERGRLKGFEAEAIEYIADRLKFKPQFVQHSWDMLPEELKSDRIDVIFNGYAWSPERGREMAATIPYGIVRMRLIVRKGDAIRDWPDLKPGPHGKRRVGTLRGSNSEKYLLKHFANDVHIEALGIDGTVGVLLGLKNGRLDASVQDEFTAGHYLKHDFPELEMVGEPVAPAYMVAYTRNVALRDGINEVLREMMRNGTLKKIYTAYDVWHEEQEKLLDVARNWPPREEEAATDLWPDAWLLVKAAGMTVVLACVAMPAAMLLGLLIALGRLYGPRWLNPPLTLYVEVLRGTPLLLQLFVIYYLLPNFGIFLPAFWAAVIGLTLNYSAYESEHFRAGLLAIPRGQMEAALTLGLSKWAALRRIVLPQAMRNIVPSVTNDFIALFKDTSVCSVIAVAELTGQYQRLLVAQPQLILSFAAMTALLYLMMSFPLSLLARRLEHRAQPVMA
jgi:polar amino acid transport system substrate-binding protein